MRGVPGERKAVCAKVRERMKRRAVGGMVVGIAIVALAVLGVSGMNGGTWKVARVGTEAVTVPPSWHRHQLTHGVVFYGIARSHNEGLWFYPTQRAAFQPGQGSVHLASPQPGITEWQTTKGSVLTLYGVAHFPQPLDAICIVVPSSQKALGLQILGSWQTGGK